MAYTGANDIITGGDTGNDLSRDIYIETLEAFNRRNVFMQLVKRQTIQTGKAGQFIIGGKTDGTDTATYARGTQIDITNTELDERTIVLERPVYVAKRIDQFEERVAHYDVRGPITNMMGETLAYKVDIKLADTVWAASQGQAPDAPLVGNPGPNANVVIPAGATGAMEKGDALAEAIFDAKAVLEGNDDYGEAVSVVSPQDYGYLVQSGQAVNADYTSGNGGYDSGTVMQVAGVRILSSNNVKGTLGGAATAKLRGLVFTMDAAGVLELIGLRTNQEDQIDFLDSTLMTAYYAIGTGVLRPESAVAILDA